MAACCEQALTNLAIPILHELFQYTDVRLQAGLRRTCVLFSHLLIPRVASCRDIRIFIPPNYPGGCSRNTFAITLERFYAKCVEWFGHSPIRTVIVEGPYDRVCQLTDLCMGLDSNNIKYLHFQQTIFIRRTFRDAFYLRYIAVNFCQNYAIEKNVCQQLTFRDVIFSQLQNILQPEVVIGETTGWEERKAYMLQEQISLVRGSLDFHSVTFHHDLLDLIERHCPEVDEEQMADVMQWKATNTTREDRWGLRYTLRGFVGQDDRPCNALYSKAWNEVDKESRKLVKAAGSVDIRQMTKIARTAFFYYMKQARKDDERREFKKARLNSDSK